MNYYRDCVTQVRRNLSEFDYSAIFVYLGPDIRNAKAAFNDFWKQVIDWIPNGKYLAEFCRNCLVGPDLALRTIAFRMNAMDEVERSVIDGGVYGIVREASALLTIRSGKKSAKVVEVTIPSLSQSSSRSVYGNTVYVSEIDQWYDADGNEIVFLRGYKPKRVFQSTVYVSNSDSALYRYTYRTKKFEEVDERKVPHGGKLSDYYGLISVSIIMQKTTYVYDPRTCMRTDIDSEFSMDRNCDVIRGYLGYRVCSNNQETWFPSVLTHNGNFVVFEQNDGKILVYNTMNNASRVIDHGLAVHKYQVSTDGEVFGWWEKSFINLETGDMLWDRDCVFQITKKYLVVWCIATQLFNFYDRKKTHFITTLCLGESARLFSDLELHDFSMYDETFIRFRNAFFDVNTAPKKRLVMLVAAFPLTFIASVAKYSML